MKTGPDISRIAALIGDPARANILTALMGGKALTVTELSHEAGVLVQTTSGHLAKLTEGGLVKPRKEGRHKYFELASSAVASVLETLMGFAALEGHMRTRTGPKDAALRAARVCYNHLAGEAGIRMYDSLSARRFLCIGDDGLGLTSEGIGFITAFGINLDGLKSNRAPLCRECLDWSERRSHLAGSLGRAIFEHMRGIGWIIQESGSRVVTFSKSGHGQFSQAFPLEAITDELPQR